MLRMLEQFIKPSLLFSRQHLAELHPSELKLGSYLGKDRLHDLPGAFLALFEDFVDAFPLLGRQVQVALYPAQELQPHDSRRERLPWTAVILPPNGAPRKNCG